MNGFSDCKRPNCWALSIVNTEAENYIRPCSSLRVCRRSSQEANPILSQMDSFHYCWKICYQTRSIEGYIAYDIFYLWKEKSPQTPLCRLITHFWKPEWRQVYNRYFQKGLWDQQRPWMSIHCLCRARTEVGCWNNASSGVTGETGHKIFNVLYGIEKPGEAELYLPLEGVHTRGVQVGNPWTQFVDNWINRICGSLAPMHCSTQI